MQPEVLNESICTHDNLGPPRPVTPRILIQPPETAELQGTLALSLLSWNFYSWLPFASPLPDSIFD